MNSEEETGELDCVLKLLSRPLSRYILSVLAGVDPGAFEGPIEIKEEPLNHADQNLQIQAEDTHPNPDD